MSKPTNPSTHQTTAKSIASGVSSYARIRLKPETSATFRAFLKRHGATVDEAIPALIEFYKSQTEYRFSADTGHLLAELRKLDASILALAQTNLHLLELARSKQQADFHQLASQIKTSATKD